MPHEHVDSIPTETVTVFKLDPYLDDGDPDELPDNLGQLIDWLQSKLGSIPIEYRDSAKIEIDADEYRLSVEITYKRRLTAEEIAQREKQLLVSIEENRINAINRLKRQLRELGEEIPY